LNGTLEALNGIIEGIASPAARNDAPISRHCELKGWLERKSEAIC